LFVAVRLVSPADVGEFGSNFTETLKATSPYRLFFADTYVGRKMIAYSSSLKTYPGNFKNDIESIRPFAAYAWIFYVKENTPADAKFLVSNIADFAYYCGRPFVRDIEDKMLPFYTASSKEDAFDTLRNLGISYVAIPGYPIAMVYNSFLSEIIGDPSLAELAFKSTEMRIFRLRQKPVPVAATPVNFFEVLSDADIKNSRATLDQPTKKFQITATPSAATIIAENGNDYSVTFGAVNKLYKARMPDERSECIARSPLKQDRLYRIRGKVRGTGLLSLKIEAQSPPRFKTEHHHVWEAILNEREMNLAETTTLDNPACFQNLIYVLGSRANAVLSDLTIEEISMYDSASETHTTGAPSLSASNSNAAAPEAKH
jgi:hypothetical protein